MVLVASGADIGKTIRRSKGTWQGIEDEIRQQYGERGGMMVVLHLAKATRRPKSGFKVLLREAGIDVQRALHITGQRDTFNGLIEAITQIYRWLVADVCPNVIKTGACNDHFCRLRHEIPEEA